MSVTIKEVITKKDLRKFIFYPEKLYAQENNWVPPIYMEQWELHNPRKNPAFNYCEAVLFLATLNDKVCGRIMGIINNKHNAQTNKKTCRFFQFDCINSKLVAKKLFEAVESWGRHKNMTEIIGSFGFSDKDPQGIQIEGFRESGTYTINYNFGYYNSLMEHSGYSKMFDIVDYKIHIPEKLHEKYSIITKRIKSRGIFKICPIRKKKEIKKHILSIFNLLNETYSDIYGYDQLSEKDMQSLSKKYYPVLNKELIKLVYKENELVAFIIAIPDFSKTLKNIRGRLFPFGFIKLMKEINNTDKLLFMLGAVKEKYRGLGIDALAMSEMISSAKAKDFKIIESNLELENNIQVQNQMLNLGGSIYKRFRIYSKTI